MPLALTSGMLIIIITYLATNISYAIVLSNDEILHTNAIAAVFNFLPFFCIFF